MAACQARLGTTKGQVGALQGGMAALAGAFAGQPAVRAALEAAAAVAGPANAAVDAAVRAATGLAVSAGQQGTPADKRGPQQGQQQFPHTPLNLEAEWQGQPATAAQAGTAGRAGAPMAAPAAAVPSAAQQIVPPHLLLPEPMANRVLAQNQLMGSSVGSGSGDVQMSQP